ncbi:Protein kinase domain-containing protein [Hirschfeldia incana]|nr:Protein kinase domain-containing protein [Hirschfeldia incana]
MEPINDSHQMVETHARPTTGAQLYPSPEVLAAENIIVTPSHAGRYIQYNICGKIIELTAKYKQPIMPIGRGAYGFVCSAMNSETNEKVSIKKIHAFENKIEAKRTLREIKLLRHFKHENIVGIKDLILPPERDTFEDVYIAYESMDTDLHNIITSNQELEPLHYEFFLYQILCGLKYIHSANVVHRDLKPSNLLVNANCQLKICDFGLAPIDIWSVGCIFLELLTRKPVFPGRDHVHQLRLILGGSPSEEELGSLSENSKLYLRQLPYHDRQSFFVKFPDVPYPALDLIMKMLKFDPRQRISVDDALDHQYLREVHNFTDVPVCLSPFNFDLEEHQFTKEEIKELIYHEALAFSPDPPGVENEN